MTTPYQSLVRLARQRRLLQKPYYSAMFFRWELVLEADGSLTSHELREQPRELDSRGVERKDPGKTLLAPSMKRTSGIAPIVSDRLDYVLGWHQPMPDDPDGEAKARQDSSRRHSAWEALIRSWAAHPSAVDDPVPAALVKFIDDGVDRIQKPEKWTSTDLVMIRVGSRDVTDAESISGFWRQHVEGKKSTKRIGVCLVCGEPGNLVATLPQSVKGTLIPGGHTSGVAPISINEAVYGYDLRDGLGHVPVCVDCAQAIPVALEFLLSDSDHVRRTPQSATVWWLDGEAPNPMELLDAATDKQIADFIDRVDLGRGTRQQVAVDEFHSLVLEANGPRLVVRDWTHLPISEILSNVIEWFNDTHVPIPLWPNGRSYHPDWVLAQSCGRYDSATGRYLRLSDKGGRHPHGITETLRTVALRRAPLPRSVAAHILQRVSADSRVDDARVALLRLFLNRTTTTKEPDMLDESYRDSAYLLGRLMAVYEAMQRAAATAGGGDAPNATFADKYLAGAISSPRLVLTVGGRQAQAWRNKLQRHQRSFFFERQVDSITELLSDPGPERATLEEQARFLLGYHHQRASDSRARIEASAKAKAQTADAVPSTDPIDS